MRAMSVERDCENGENGDLITDTSQLFRPLVAPQDLNVIYATGPTKPPKFECCRFRSRIPHYIWTNHIIESCACSIRISNHEYRTCMRLGNFTVLLERTGAKDGSELMFVLGPHWPFAILFTAGLAIVFPTVAVYVFWGIVPKWAGWFVMAVSTVVLKLLFILGFRDPGIAKRIREKPSSTLGSLQQWVWNDQANTWRTTTDSYSHEMNVVIHDVDHICPFTGTAIARKNIAWFIAFQLAVIVLGFSLVVYIMWGLILLT